MNAWIPILLEKLNKLFLFPFSSFVFSSFVFCHAWTKYSITGEFRSDQFDLNSVHLCIVIVAISNKQKIKGINDKNHKTKLSSSNIRNKIACNLDFYYRCHIIFFFLKNELPHTHITVSSIVLIKNFKEYKII